MTVETQIIPRLMLLHRNQEADDLLALRPRTVHADDVEDLLHLLDRRNPEVAVDHLLTMLDDGLALDSLLLEILAPAARRLGELWENDQKSFVEVSTALTRLQSLVRIACSSAGESLGSTSRRYRTLITSCPGDQHSFGLFVVEQFFRMDGWSVDVCHGESEEQLAERVRSSWYAVVCMSLAVERLLPVLTRTIAHLRAQSLNPGVQVLVGGPLFLEAPDLWSEVGADAVGYDARQAIEVAGDLVARVAESPQGDATLGGHPHG